MKTGGAGRWNSREPWNKRNRRFAYQRLPGPATRTRVNMGVTSARSGAALAILNQWYVSRASPADEFKPSNWIGNGRARRVAGFGRGGVVRALPRAHSELPDWRPPVLALRRAARRAREATLAATKDRHKRNVTPENALLVDGQATSTPTRSRPRLGRTALRREWKGPKPGPVSISMPGAHRGDRDLRHGSPGQRAKSRSWSAPSRPERTSRETSALATANQILGGGVSSRLFLDVREEAFPRLQHRLERGGAGERTRSRSCSRPALKRRRRPRPSPRCSSTRGASPRASRARRSSRARNDSSRTASCSVWKPQAASPISPPSSWC